MKNPLYNEEFKVNDLIRASHPSGGTLVIDDNSKEGVVEDIIEAQMKTLEMIYRNPALETLAELGTDLDSQGFKVSASSVDSVLEKVAVSDESLWGKHVLREKNDSLWSVADILKELDNKTRSWGYNSHIYNQKIETKQGYPLAKAFRLHLDSLYQYLDAFKKSPSEKIVDGFNSIIYEMLNLVDQSLRYDPYMSYNRGVKPLVEKLGSAWQKLTATWQKVKSDRDNAKPSPDNSKPVPDNAKPSPDNSKRMRKVQKLINRLLGENTVGENGYEGDSNTWKVVRERLKLKAGKDFSNYRQLIKILEARMSKVEKETPRAKSRDKGEESPSYSKMQDRHQTSDINFTYQGKDYRDFPIARALRYVADPGALDATSLKKYVKSNYKGVMDQVSYFLAWLKQYGVISNLNIKSLVPKFPGIKTALLDGVFVGSDKKLRDYSRLRRYLNVIASLMNASLEIKKDDQRGSSGSKINVFDFLRAKFPPNSRAFSLMENNSAARASMLNWLVNKNLADRQENMLKTKNETTGFLPVIQDQIQSILRGYGLK